MKKITYMLPDNSALEADKLSFVGAPQPFVDAGKSFIDAGDPFVDAGEPFIDARQPFVGAGEPFVDAGGPFVDAGDSFVDAGDSFVDAGEPFVDAGEPFVDAGEPFENNTFRFSKGKNSLNRSEGLIQNQTSSLPSHPSPLISPFSPLTSPFSPLTSHFSPLTSPFSSPTSPFSPLTSPFSPLTSHLSLLTSHRSSLTAHLSLLIALFSLLFALSSPLTAQNESYLYRVNSYNFIRYDLNELHHFGTDRYSTTFYGKVEKLLKAGEGKINVVQIGGSHIQAGTFSGQIRSRLQQMNGEMNAGWGYMFPYRMLRTNSPYGYYIRYTGSWEGCRNVQRRKSCQLGVGGVAATTQSAHAELTILLEDENELDYRFNKVRVFYENEGANYSVSIDTAVVKTTVKTDAYFDFELKQRVDSLTLSIQKSKGESGSFTLFGITTEAAPNGFVYHSIGVNGAHVPAFLRCQLFGQQLADLKPDLVILGLGINDAYVKNFSQNDFERNYGELIARIRRAAPETAIVFITNNDSYMYRRYVNKNGKKVEQSMLKMAKKHGAGVWDMYEVMGGLNSVVLWEKKRLAQRDKIHFTREGYLLLGDLFFNALMQGFEEYMKNEKDITMNGNGLP